MEKQKIKLGVQIYGRSEKINGYLSGEFGMFDECATSEPEYERYVSFLDSINKNRLQTKDILVDHDILLFFLNDVENRASIDYHEPHYSYDKDITAGGMAMDRLHKRILKAHPQITHAGFLRHSF
jgi:hypothetical protein